MKNTDSIPDKYLAFASLLIIANRMETLLSRDFSEFGVTTKQWFLSATIKNLFEKPPTIKQVARQIGNSHQNVKQVALKLQQKGLLLLVKDKRDARVTRLKMTDYSYAFWEKTEPKGDAFIEEMLKDISIEDLAIAKSVLEKILSNLSEMDDANIDHVED